MSLARIFLDCVDNVQNKPIEYKHLDRLSYLLIQLVNRYPELKYYFTEGSTDKEIINLISYSTSDHIFSLINNLDLLICIIEKNYNNFISNTVMNLNPDFERFVYRLLCGNLMSTTWGKQFNMSLHELISAKPHLFSGMIQCFSLEQIKLYLNELEINSPKDITWLT